jgi:hypothetical protein
LATASPTLTLPPNTAAAALFASNLQKSDRPSAAARAAAIRRALAEFGEAGCIARMAQEFGDHSDTAVPRMRWCRKAVAGRKSFGSFSALRRRLLHAISW